MRSSVLEPRSDLRVDQQAVLYPSFAYQHPQTDLWTALVYGFAYQETELGMRQRMFLKLLRRVLSVSADELRDNEIFQSRIRGFLAEPQRGRKLVVKIGDQPSRVLRPSKRNGHFRGYEPLCNSLADVASLDRKTRTLPCSIVLPEGDERSLEGRIEAIPKSGVSVISDIDDTIKISQVAHRRQLLHNTFIHPFATVPGMSQLYQSWRKQGAIFHYVSSSPWQLYEPLNELLHDSEFPAGSFHLRTIRFGDPTVLRLFISRKRTKYHVIRTLFRLFPERRFVLVGDSGEKDPEIYGTIAHKFPTQIERILIRRVEGRKWTKKRVEKAFGKIPRELWQTFRVPTQVRPLDLRGLS